MTQYIKRYLAVRSYARGLSQDLVRRFGKKRFYSIEQVRQGVQRGKFSPDFIAYAHAAFCSEHDFCAHYQNAGAAGHYRDLRRVIGRRYLWGQLEFDASTIITRFRREAPQGEFSESHIGEDYPDP